MGRQSADFPVVLDGKEYNWINQSYHAHVGITKDALYVRDYHPHFGYVFENFQSFTIGATGMDGRKIYSGSYDVEAMRKAIINDWNKRGRAYLIASLDGYDSLKDERDAWIAGGKKK